MNLEDVLILDCFEQLFFNNLKNNSNIFELKAVSNDCFDKSNLIVNDIGDSPIYSYNHIRLKQRRNKRENF